MRWTLIATFLTWFILSMPATAVASTSVERGPIRVELVEEFRSTTGAQLGIPTDLRYDGAGNRFLSDQNGVIRSLSSGGVLNSTPTLDISADTNPSGGRGLLSFAFHPDYLDSSQPGFRKFYTYHASPDVTSPVDFNSGLGSSFAHVNVLTEWEMDATGTTAIPGSQRELLRAGHPNALVHSGGGMAFDDQGYLALGFGTPQPSLGQNTLSLIGSLIRIDPLDPMSNNGSVDAVSANGNYRIPISNPFVGDSTALDEIYAIGLRQAYKLSYDSESQNYFEGDVGQGSREEINVIVPGGNYGWPFLEGTIPGPGANNFPDPRGPVVNPLAEYDHSEGRSVVGGIVYRGDGIPELTGKYVFGDLIGTSGQYFAEPGRLFYADVFDQNGDVRDTSQIEVRAFYIGFDDRDIGMGLTGLSVDEDGELLLIGAAGNRDVVKRLVSLGPIISDFNEDNFVGGDDFLDWQRGFEATYNQDHLADWQTHYGLEVPVESTSTIPEPTAIALALLGLGVLSSCRFARQD